MDIKKITAGPVTALALCMMTACHSGAGGNGGGDTDAAAAKSVAPASAVSKKNPAFRDAVKKEPVAEYKVRTDDKLNEMYFWVRVYETKETMKFVAKVEYESVTGEDTIRLPDMGYEPKPAVQKGPEKYSCIIGFTDEKGQFNDIKKVYVTDKGGELKITTLKRYSVTGE